MLEDFFSVLFVFIVMMGANIKYSRKKIIVFTILLVWVELLITIPMGKIIANILAIFFPSMNIFFLKGSKKKWFSLFLPTYTMVSVMQTVCMMVYNSKMGWIETYRAHALIGFPVLLLLAGIIFFNKRKNVSIQYSYSVLQRIMLNIGSIALWLLLGEIQYFFKYHTSSIRFISDSYTDIVYVAIFAVCILLCILSLYLGILEKNSQEAHQYAMETKFLLEVQQEQIDTIVKSEERLHAFKHDLIAHLNAVTALADEGDIEKIQEYCNNLLQDSSSFRKVSYTGNTAIDGILGQIKTMADERNIDLEIQMVVPKEKKIGDYDLCILLSNILKNAVEANENGGKVSIQSWPFNDNLCIISTNTTDHPLDYKDGVLMSHKRENSTQGYGMRNIQAVIDKYDGDFQINYEGNLVTVEAMV